MEHRRKDGVSYLDMVNEGAIDPRKRRGSRGRVHKFARDSCCFTHTISRVNSSNGSLLFLFQQPPPFKHLPVRQHHVKTSIYTLHINHQYQSIPIKISGSMAKATVMLEDAEQEMKKLSWEIEQADELVLLHNNF